MPKKITYYPEDKSFLGLEYKYDDSFRPSGRRQDRSYLMIYQQGLEVIAKEDLFNPSTLRVLLYIMSKLDYLNFFYRAKKDIFLDLNMRPPTVYRALSCLRKTGVLIYSRDVATGFILHEELAWKGTKESRGRRQTIYKG